MISRMRRAGPCGIRTWRSVWASAGLPSPEFDLSMTAAIDLAICTWPGIIRICPIFDDSSCWLYSNSIRFHMAWMFEVFLHQRNSLGFLYQQTIWIPLELQLSKSINHNTRGKQSNIGFLHSSFEVHGVAMLSVSPLAPVSIPSHLAPGLQPPAHTSSASSAGCRWPSSAVGLLGAVGVARSRRKAVVTGVERKSKVARAPKPKASFNWEKQWYPVLPLSMLEGSGPEPIKLLNKDLVLWKDGDGEWRCNSGICPHRLAPLAHGRVNSDGQLMCRFHGWCFKGNGSCSKVPMAEGDEEAKARLLGQERSKLASYPTKIKKGLLFVWPHAGSEKEALGKDPFVPEELSESPNWSCFDVPAGWRVWLEQSWDPSHAPFLHQYALPNFAPEYASAMEPFQRIWVMKVWRLAMVATCKAIWVWKPIDDLCHRVPTRLRTCIRMVALSASIFISFPLSLGRSGKSRHRILFQAKMKSPSRRATSLGTWCRCLRLC